MNELITMLDHPSPQNGLDLSWFALRVRSNFERIASLHLQERGYEQFSPTFTVERQWSDRKKRIEQHIFTGYVFCRFNVNQRLPILTVPGAVSLVGFGDGPAAIPDREIDSIRQMVSSGFLVSPWPFLSTGQRVLIEKGPLAGVEGILVAIKKVFRLVVSVNMLQRSISVEVDRQVVRPL